MTFANQMLEPYIKSSQIWVCPSNPGGFANVDPSGVGTDPPFRSYGGQNSYAFNNYAFSSNTGFKLAALTETANTVAMVDSRYYNALPKNPCALAGNPTGTAFVTGGSYPRYWQNLGNSYAFRTPAAPTAAESEELFKNRHLETLNVLFLDGHVKALGYARVVNDAGLVAGSTTSVWDPYKQGCA